MSLCVAPDILPLGFPRSISDSLVFFGYFQVPSFGFVAVVVVVVVSGFVVVNVVVVVVVVSGFVVVVAVVVDVVGAEVEVCRKRMSLMSHRMKFPNKCGYKAPTRTTENVQHL